MATKPTKAEVRRWMARARADLRDLEAALKDNNWEFALEMANDLSGAGAEAANVIDARLTGYDDTGSYGPPKPADWFERGA